MTEAKSRIKKIIDELESLLNSENQEDEQPKPLLTGPCIAKTRRGVVVSVHRGCRIDYYFQYLIGYFFRTVSEDGKYRSDKTAHASDIVEVVRPLTEQEVLDWQFRGIEPDLNVASEFGHQLPEGFEHSDVGRKEAEDAGMVYLGRATRFQDVALNGQLHVFQEHDGYWDEKNNGSTFFGFIYAYKPAT